MVEENDDDLEAGALSAQDNAEEEDDMEQDYNPLTESQRSSSRSHTANRSMRYQFRWIYLAIVIAGSSLSGILLYFGITNARNDAKRQFELDGTLVSGLHLVM